MKKIYIFIIALNLLSTKVNANVDAYNIDNSQLLNKEMTILSGGSSTDDFQLFDLEIFSLSKKKENAFDAPSSIYIISSEDIRRSGATNIPEALRLAPSVQVARSNNHTWSISIRGFNHQYSNKLLVMIDGRTIYTPLFSGVFWNIHDYVLEDIEKIEVVKGPGGTMWGANAVNGIINIITKNATLTQGGHFSTIVGNEDRLITEARYGGKTKSNNHYRIYAKQGIRDGSKQLHSNIGNGDNFKTARGGFRYDIRSIIDNKIAIYGDIQTSKSNNYFANVLGDNGKPSHFYSQTGNIAVSWDKILSKKSSFTLDNYFNYDQFNVNILKYINRTFNLDFQHFYNFSNNNQLTWGLGYRLINDAIGVTAAGIAVTLDYDPQGKNDEVFSAFIQDKIGLIEDKLYLTVGSKFENNDYTGFEIQPNVRLAFYPTDNQTIWTSISRAVRTPQRSEEALILQGGNTGYDSEILTAYELGYRIKPTRKTLIDISTFFNDYNKLKTLESVLDNRAYGEGYGFEITSKWQVNNDWLLEASYDFIVTEIHLKSGSTSTLEYLYEKSEPKNQFRLRSNYNITPQIEFDNALYYVDSVKVYPRGDPNIPAYIRFDTRIGYLPNENLELSIVGQNLTDKKHQEFTNASINNKVEIGRAFYFKVVLKF